MLGFSFLELRCLSVYQVRNMKVEKKAKLSKLRVYSKKNIIINNDNGRSIILFMLQNSRSECSAFLSHDILLELPFNSAWILGAKIIVDTSMNPMAWITKELIIVFIKRWGFFLVEVFMFFFVSVCWIIS